MRLQRIAVTSLLIAGLVAASLPALAKKKGEPDVVVVQHVLIGFKKTVRGKKLDRTRKQAQALAQQILERAQAGEDFGALVEEFSDDRPPGIFRMTNDGVPLMARSYERKGMAVYFGDVAFRLAVGEVGLARYHAANSPFGYHVIKRIE